jgi:hypothetical protein
MLRLVATLALTLLPGAALAQAPEDEWNSIPSSAPPLPPPPPPASLPPPPPAPPPSRQVFSVGGYAGPVRPRPEVLQRVRGPEDRNAVSMLGATTLGQWNRGQLFSLGFPLFSLRFLIGLTERFDLGVAYDSFWFQMNEPRLVARLGLYQGPTVAFAATLEAGYAFFNTRASRELRGARWLTGRRNVNVSPALLLSVMGPGARAARFFFEARYTLALDTEPYATDPLVGVPAAVVPGHNVGLKGGAELPLTAKTSFFFSLSLEIHGREIDVPLLPNLSVGLVTSL